MALRYLRDLRVSTKLLLIAAVNLTIAVVVGVWAVRGLGTMDAALEGMYRRDVLAIEAAAEPERAARRVAVEGLALAAAAAGAGSLDIGGAEANIAAYEADFDRAMESYLTIAPSADERDRIARVRAAWQAYTQSVHAFLRMVRAGADPAGIGQALQEQVSPRRQALLQELEQLAAVNVAAAQSRYEASRRLYGATRSGLLAVIVVGAVLGAAASLATSRLVTRPLRAMVEGARRMAQGDLTRRIGYAGGDEVRQAAMALDQAAEGLMRLIRTVRQSAEQVASASEQLASTAQEMGRAAEQVAETVSQMAKGGQRQSAAAGTTSENARAMGEMVRQVADATRQMAEQADQAARLARDGQAALAGITQRMAQIQATVGESGRAVQDLGQRSQRIGQIVDVITGIAEQTNLLALNAAIEAARAGDQGRGFAVVAEEVRKLAEQSRQAAAEIASLIGEIRREVDRAVRNTEAGSQAVDEGVREVEASGQTFEAITRAVEEMVGRIQQVSAAAQHMAEAGDQVVKAVDEIAAITEQNAAGAEEVASTTQAQSSAVQEMAGSAASLANLAQELMKTVAAFKV